MTGLVRLLSRLSGNPQPAARGSPWQVHVDVYLNNMNADPPQFEVQSCLQHVPNGPLVFHNRRRDGFDLHFELHDVNNSGYSFPQNPNEAVWSQLGNQCFDVAPVPPNAIFQPLRVQQHGSILVVHNPNPRLPSGQGQGPFQYVLRLRNAAGQEKRLDPGGDNQNGQAN